MSALTDAEIHDALIRHALTEQGWAGPGADLSGVPLKRMLEVEDETYGGTLHVDSRAIAAIYVAFNYEGESGQCSSPVVIANRQAVCVVKLPKEEKP